MPISPYIKGLREKVGHAPLLTPGADALVYDADGSLLLMRRRDDGLWGIPGGQLDPLEPPALGVVREVLEETGLLVRPVALLGVFGGVDDFHLATRTVMRSTPSSRSFVVRSSRVSCRL